MELYSNKKKKVYCFPTKLAVLECILIILVIHEAQWDVIRQDRNSLMGQTDPFNAPVVFLISRLEYRLQI